MEKKTFFIPNISCGHCVATIQKEIGEIPGVSTVEGDLKNKKVRIAYDTAATLEKIVAALKDLNYPPIEGQ
jgi:copper ion binding protein